MKITTKIINQGIELRTESIAKEIYNSNKEETKKTMIGLLEAVRDVSTILNDIEFEKELFISLDNAIEVIKDLKYN